MKKFFFFLFAVLVAGCAYPRSYEIAQPPGPDRVIVQPTPPAVVPGQVPAAPQPQVEVWRPDPTRILVCNDSRTLFLEVWIDSGPPVPPMFSLVPELCKEVNVMLGDHFWYAQGCIETPAFRRVSVGTARRDFYIRNWSYWGGYVWRLPIYDSDFGR